MSKQSASAVAAIAAALLTAGCATHSNYSPVPLATNYPSARQMQVQAGAHWQAISAHIEQQLGPALRQSPNLPLYVAPLQASAFNQTVTSQLITALVNHGYVVGKQPAGALKVDIDTQVVGFSADRPQYRYAGQRSALVQGSWVINGVEAPPPAGISNTSEDAYAWFSSQFAPGATPKTEIVVTISVSDERRYYARTTSVYYITDSDRALYDVALPKQARDAAAMKSFAVQGGQP